MAETETIFTTEAEQTVDTEQTEATEDIEQAQTESAEIARLRAELARQKAATDKATKEAASYRKELRSKQSAEEAAAEDARLHQEEIEKELAELRKEKAVANTSKKVFTFVQDETTANSIAEALFGAVDIDLAMDMFNKAWAAREKALKLEYGKVPAPGVGAPDGPSITKAQLDGMGYKDRLDFATKHPEEYNKLMGR